MVLQGVEFVFLLLAAALAGLTFLSHDWRIRTGSITMVTAWVGSIVHDRIFIGLVPDIAFEGIANLAVFYIFLQLHFRQDDEIEEPIWPALIVVLEVLIFGCTIFRLFGSANYTLAVDVLFGTEMAIILLIGAAEVFSRRRVGAN